MEWLPWAVVGVSLAILISIGVHNAVKRLRRIRQEFNHPIQMTKDEREQWEQDDRKWRYRDGT
jgi:hypothetical protein